MATYQRRIHSVMGYGFKGQVQCPLSSDDTTLNALLSEPGDETQSGINLFKGFDEDMAKSTDQMILNH